MSTPVLTSAPGNHTNQATMNTAHSGGVTVGKIITYLFLTLLTVIFICLLYTSPSPRD